MPGRWIPVSQFILSSRGSAATVAIYPFDQNHPRPRQLRQARLRQTQPAVPLSTVYCQLPPCHRKGAQRPWRSTRLTTAGFDNFDRLGFDRLGFDRLSRRCRCQLSTVYCQLPPCHRKGAQRPWRSSRGMEIAAWDQTGFPVEGKVATRRRERHPAALVTTCNLSTEYWQLPPASTTSTGLVTVSAGGYAVNRVLSTDLTFKPSSAAESPGTAPEPA